STGAGALTITPAATSEGALTVSPNGRYLGLAGFRTGTNAGTTARVIGQYDVLPGAVNTATAIPNSEAYGTNSIRSAVWNDAGNRFWSSGTGSGGGTRTNTFGAT